MEPNINQSNLVQTKLSPKFFFLSFGVLVTLITVVTSFLNLIFDTLNKKFPDALNGVYQYGYDTYQYEGIRTAIATLIIIFPVFLVLSYYWNKTAKGGLSHISEVIRKWMLYLIIFLSAIVAVVDLVTLVQYFLRGEITTRFIMKVVTTLLTIGVVGSYHLLLLRQKENLKIWMPKLFAVISLVIVVVGVGWSFTVIGSPSTQRAYGLDSRRVSDLQNIQSQVISYWQQKEKLPTKIEDLVDPLSYNSLPVDPEFEKGTTYTYKMNGKLTFELCATFSAKMPKGWTEYVNGGGIVPMYSGAVRDVSTSASPVSYPYPGGGGGANQSWDHEAGLTCFSRTIDPEIYKPYNPTSNVIPMKAQ